MTPCSVVVGYHRLGEQCFLNSWRWRQLGPPNRCYPTTSPRGVTMQTSTSKLHRRENLSKLIHIAYTILLRINEGKNVFLKYHSHLQTVFLTYIPSLGKSMLIRSSGCLCVCVLRFLNQLTDFYETWYTCYSIGGHLNRLILISYNQ
jgi:hypothetical protein